MLVRDEPIDQCVADFWHYANNDNLHKPGQSKYQTNLLPNYFLFDSRLPVLNAQPCTALRSCCLNWLAGAPSSRTTRFTSCISVLCLCSGSWRNRLRSDNKQELCCLSWVLLNNTHRGSQSSLKPFITSSQWNKWDGPRLTVSPGGLAVTKETAAVHIIYSQSARAPVYQLNRPPGHK